MITTAEFSYLIGLAIGRQKSELGSLSNDDGVVNVHEKAKKQ